MGTITKAIYGNCNDARKLLVYGVDYATIKSVKESMACKMLFYHYGLDYDSYKLEFVGNAKREPSKPGFEIKIIE